jgi:small RNA 2'-O-methyltransferase
MARKDIGIQGNYSRQRRTQRRLSDGDFLASLNRESGTSVFAEQARIEDCEVESTELHLARLDAVELVLEGTAAAAVADLGCGDGVLTRRLLQRERIKRVVAIDLSVSALTRLERSVPREVESGRLRLVHGSFVTKHDEAQGVDAVVMLETIEHVDPERLSALERTVFDVYRPVSVIITTPNQEFNVLYGLSPGQFREPRHRFEWTRLKFESWSCRVARRYGFDVSLGGIGESDPLHGSPSQLAHFTRV